MKRMTVILAGAMIAALAPRVFAQGGAAEMSYCRSLITTYTEKVGMEKAPPAVSQAITNCRSGNTLAGIPALEQALRNAKVPLPPRSTN